APVNGVGQLTIAPGERYDVVVNFAGLNTNDEVLLENGAGAPFPNGTVDLTQVMKFRVLGSSGDVDPLPATLRPVVPIDPATAVVTRDLRLKRTGDDGCGRQNWLINDLGWQSITEYPELGTVEIWRFINDSGVAHPMHMHLVGFQILDRDGFTKGAGGEIIPNGSPQLPPPEERGWKDTALVMPNQILRVITRFEDYKGKYPYHCHIIEHEDHEMMRQFQSVLCGDAALDPSETCDDGGTAALDGCGASCDVEEFVLLGGTATGGSVSVTVGGHLITVTTTAGQTASQVAAALAAAMSAQGVAATAQGARVVTTSDITAVTIADAGLTSRLDLRAEKTRLWWGSVAGATTYDVVRGSLIPLRTSGGNFALTTVTQICAANNTASTYYLPAETPASGQGIWYLVRSQSAGSYDEGVASQSGSRDAEIAASGNGCP
ncbi:MAG TPA: multicopper oxidase domain-containing protein, partial [Candidatus Polarisedimenticolaceae bacterium]|nr:multicopper oxidase domain-containing protein [Candidatus Polarisedimenticolaceae bacterium]